MRIFNYDKSTGVLIGESTAQESPLEPGVWLIPAAATTVEPPAVAAGEEAVWQSDHWEVRRVMAPAPPAAPAAMVASLPMPVAEARLLGLGFSINELKDLLGLLPHVSVRGEVVGVDQRLQALGFSLNELKDALGLNTRALAPGETPPTPEAKLLALGLSVHDMKDLLGLLPAPIGANDPVPTPEQKLAKVGLTVSELRALLAPAAASGS